MEVNMVYISVAGVFLLGIGATLKYAYKVWKGKIKDIGSLMAFAYLTVLYGLYNVPGLIKDVAPFVRIGIAMLFLVKIITFAYDLWMEILNKRCESYKDKNAGGT